MFSKKNLETLLQYEAKPGSPVLSAYLDTDQSNATNVNRGFEVVLKNMLRDVEQSLDNDARKEFETDAAQVLEYLKNYREPKQGLVIFQNKTEGLFWIQALRVAVRNGVWWRDTPYVRPLLELLDEHERYGVVLTDREHAWLFTVFLGEVEEHLEAFAKADVTHIKTSGTDHLRSQMNFQRKSDEHAHSHLKHIAELMSRLATIHEFDRLIIAGTVEATSELYGLLPKFLRTRVAGKISLAVESNVARVLEETLKIEEDVERKREVDLVEELITAASKQKQAVRGLDDTLLALQEWRVWQLVYADGFGPRGGQCTNCGALLAKDTEGCGYCGEAVRVVEDLIELAAARVMEMQGKVEQVRGAAATRLKEAGSVGALLRY
jgi:peptide subunit release factor 1 (eRF1)